ncbi:hypothetical protein MIR68_001452 [Amoeboaphelidium protococcarum]|nr:hypothetical protein MIR68_001452 [Amoeboaphelidium protococcarum]
MKVLVCGGAGYIGSHLVREMMEDPKYSVVILDNLSAGHREALPQGISFEHGNINDAKFLDKVFTTHKPDAVMHFCASISVSESCEKPLEYYENNVSATITLLQAMKKYGVKYFIFSSTAALFGDPERMPIEAGDRVFPLNPYGESKYMVEQILNWVDQADGIKSVCLRYFNACGAHESGEIGEFHEPETHLIPVILQIPLGKRKEIKIYGDDYPTKDGTCVRDYIHVSDLATAHIKALEYMVRENKSDKFNLGSGQGFTVKEIVEAARKVTGHPIPAVIEKRRAGDAAVLVASSSKAEQVLGWERKYKSVEKIVESAWNFYQKHPKGYSHSA